MKPLEQIIEELRRPFTSQAVQFKIQSTKNKALIVSYIDARQVVERLNTVCPEQWSDSYREIVVGDSIAGVECMIEINASGAGGATHIRGDVGVSEGGGFGGLKAVYSDALKRAGVPWGIGVSLYYTPKFYANVSDLDGGGKYLSRKVEHQARDAYSKWLSATGIERFGEPLDLGDIEDSQGDVETGPEPHEPNGQSEPVATTQTVEVATPKLPRAGKDPQDNVLRNAYRLYLAQADNDKEARRKFGLWLNANNLPSELSKLTEEQHDLVYSFLTEGSPDD